MVEKLKEKEIIEKEDDADTSPAMEQDTDDTVPGLNNASVPTPEQEENAGLDTPTPVPEIDAGLEEQTQEPETNLEPNPEQDLESDLAGQTQEGELKGTSLMPETEEGEINSELGIAEGSATKTFTQSQVDEIAGKARKEGREKALKDTFARYGVTSVEELDDLFGDAQRFVTSQDELKEKTKFWEENDRTRNEELTTLKESVALMESGIDKSRYEDAKLILKGKGLDVTAENIAQELTTHPEWKKTELNMQDAGSVPTPDFPFRKNGPALPPEPGPVEPATKIEVPQPKQNPIPVLGNNSTDNPQPELSERERAMKLFKV